MNIPIKYAHFLDPELILKVFSSYGCIIKDTKALGFILMCMMAGWSYSCKNRIALRWLFENSITCFYGSSSCHQGALISIEVRIDIIFQIVYFDTMLFQDLNSLISQLFLVVFSIFHLLYHGFSVHSFDIIDICKLTLNYMTLCEKVSVVF